MLWKKSNRADPKARAVADRHYNRQKPGTTVVALLPARTDTELFHRYIYGKAEIRFLKGRVSFLDHGKETGKPLFGSMICIWRYTRENHLSQC